MIKKCYVIDNRGIPLSPTSENKGWILIRKKKAVLISRLPFTIQLLRKQDNTDSSENIFGIDVGSKFTGISTVSKCKTKNKVQIKGTIYHRQDVSKLISLRAGQRKYRRSHKRHRPARFSNRASSRRKGRIPPSIKTHKEEILRIIGKISKFIRIDKIIIEDVAIDIRRLTDGKKVYKWQYQKSNRLDENIRKATIIRDDNKCQMCGKSNCMIEVHHITPRRLKGSNTIKNLISLCGNCHKKVTGREMDYAERLYNSINGKNIRFDYSQRAMQGKTYLRKCLSDFYPVELTKGCDTANKRIDWGIEKTHSNDAIVITDLFIKQEQCGIKDWYIKPLRSKKKSKSNLKGFKLRDIIKYTKRNGESYIGYITSIDLKKKSINFSNSKKVFKRYGINNCILLQRNKSINFI